MIPPHGRMGGMAYESFTLPQLRERFEITLTQKNNLYGNISPVVASDYLTTTLQRNLPLALGKSSEKSRSELLITPILVEVRALLNDQIAVFSGVRFDVERASGLIGFCDFLISRDPLLIEIEAPVIAVAEAKKEDLNTGVAQCIAEMIAAQRFNARRAQAIPTIYGVLTSGTDWRFLQIEGTQVTLDLREYPITEIDRILGILVAMAS
jgi:hypothetical protein